MQRHFFSTLHPLSTVIFATATVLAFVLLCSSRFNFHCYTQREAMPTPKSARKCAATSRDFLRKRLQSAFTLANKNLIMHYISLSIPPPPLHPHTRTHPHTHTHNLATPHFSLSLPVSLHLPYPPKSSVSQWRCLQQNQHKINIKSSTAANAPERVRAAQSRLK